MKNILGEHELGISQFDSLLNSNVNIEPKFLSAGLEMLHKTNQNQRLIEIFRQLDEEEKAFICSKNWIPQTGKSNGEENFCAGVKIEEEPVSHPELQNGIGDNIL